MGQMTVQIVTPDGIKYDHHADLFWSKRLMVRWVSILDMKN